MGAVTEDAFCLKWNDFHTSLTSSFAELREESDLLDATVVCDGTPMRAHKLVLSACSGVFRQLFRSPFSPIFCPQAAAAAGPHFRGYWGNGQAAAVADSGALHMVPTVQVDPNVAPPPPQLPEPFR